MKKSLISAFLVFNLLLIGCNDKPSLQKYFVENSEKKDFIALDVSPSILNINKAKLTPEQTAALGSFDRMNVLAFKRDEKNQAEFEKERNKIKSILKDEKYQELMRFGSGKDGASVSFIGEDEHINEFVVYASKAENGFAVVRVLGKDMSPTTIMNMVSVIKESNIDLEQLKPLQDLVTQKK